MTGPEIPDQDGTVADDRPPFDPAVAPPRADDVPEDHPVGALLAAVADDPAAPVSAVTVASVLAAVRAGRSGADPDEASDDEIARVTDIDPLTGRPRYVPPIYARPLAEAVDAAPAAAPAAAATGAAPVPAPVWSGSAVAVPAAVPASVLAARRLRRRRTTAILAAAAFVGVAAVAVPFALSQRDGSTSTSASATAATTAAATTATAVASAASGAAGGPVATTTLGFDGPGALSSGGSEGSSSPEPVQSPESAQESGGLPVSGATLAAGGGSEAGSGSCSWTALPQPVEAAITGALPGGAYGQPQPLTAGCRPDGVYGAVLPSLQNQPALTVTLSKTVDGACTTASPACVSAGQGQFLGSTSTGELTLYAYASGWEAMIAPDGADAGDPTAGAATVEELFTAAQAAAAAAAG